MSKNSSISAKRRAARGQTMTEYALILAAIATVLISLYTSAGTMLTTLIGKVGPLL
jgi:Flp pilus assembly pilin Flp